MGGRLVDIEGSNADDIVGVLLVERVCEVSFYATLEFVDAMAIPRWWFATAMRKCGTIVVYLLAVFSVFPGHRPPRPGWLGPHAQPHWLTLLLLH
jgi:hypothetical protein